MPRFGLKTILGCFVGLGALFALVVPAIQQVQEAGRRTTCKNTIRQLGLGMLNYESAYGHLPIGIEESPTGTSFRSWRPLVNPFLESAQQFYDPNFAWDSPQNARLYDGSKVTATDKGGGNPRQIILDSCPHWFWRCPSDSRIRTNYAVVVGNETAFPLNRSVTLAEITDGPENTILIVETLSGSSVWTEPRDIQFNSMKFVIDYTTNGELASKHPNGVNVCFADGLTYTVTRSISPDELRALLTIAGGESVTRQELLDRGILR